MHTMRIPQQKKQPNERASQLLWSFVMLFLMLANNAEAGCIYSKPLQAAMANNTNILSWSTMSEEKNDFFVIERSVDGISFETAVMVEGAGESSEEKNYRFVDIATESSRTYYRLLQVDFDGTTTMTHTLVVTQKKEKGLFDLKAMSSSTTDRYFSLIIESEIDHQMEDRVMSLMGDIQKEGQSQVIKGTNALAVDLEGLEVGTYQFALKVKNEQEILNIRKVDSKEMPDINLARRNNKN